MRNLIEGAASVMQQGLTEGCLYNIEMNNAQCFARLRYEQYTSLPNPSALSDLPFTFLFLFNAGYLHHENSGFDRATYIHTDVLQQGLGNIPTVSRSAPTMEITNQTSSS